MAGDFENLDPERIRTLVESAWGLQLDGTIEAFNSYVNRVFGLADIEGGRWVVKFYRPGRWTVAAIEEEHSLLFVAQDAEIPVVCPLLDPEGYSLQVSGELRYALFPRRAGRSFDPDSGEERYRIGALVGRLHAAIAEQKLEHRLVCDPSTATRGFLKEIEEAGILHPDSGEDYLKLAGQVLDAAAAAFQSCAAPIIPLHGDLHRGNILDRMDEGLLLIDFDDAMSGPAVQDLWMLMGDRIPQAQAEWEVSLEGYETFFPFDRRQLDLVEPLRAMRMIYYLAWQCRQRKDPRFMEANPDWASSAFWIKELEDLKEQAREIGV